MELTINQITSGCADGHYHVKAKGCIVASLHWADEKGALPDWQPFAYFPIEPNGVGTYHFTGGRAIPADATHVLAPYLSRDKQLQQILNESGKQFVFLSGHTHVSMSCSCGCVDRDDNGNIYLNAGSIRPTTLQPDVPLQPECWTEGNVVELLISEHHTRVTGISMKTGQKIARGYYSFMK